MNSVSFYAGAILKSKLFTRSEHSICLKARAFAQILGSFELLSAREQKILEMAAVLHGLGRNWRRRNADDPRNEDAAGAAWARDVLIDKNLKDKDKTGFVNEVCRLLEHLHDYDSERTDSLQCLREAVFLAEKIDSGLSSEEVRAQGKDLFKTEFGIMLLEDMFPDKEKE